MDMKIELIMVPVSDPDRSRAFYEQVGWNIDHDQTVSDDIRFVQVTPPGSACSIAFGLGLTEQQPGTMNAIQLVVADADTALAELTERGIDAQGVQDLAWGRFVSFSDPDGNTYSLQELPDYSQQG